MSSAFQMKLFKLEATAGAYSTEINKFLKYDFKNALNPDFKPLCLDNGYWRNLYAKGDEAYMNYYKTAISSLKDKINGTTFSFVGKEKGIDLTPYFLGITLSLNLNDLVDAITLEFKENDIAIDDNDLIEVRENGEIIFLGFVVKTSVSSAYEERPTQKVLVLNVGKMYSLSQIVHNPALAEYAINGTDLKRPNQTVLTDIFNDKNVFDIIKYLMEGFFLCKENKNSSKTTSYVLNDEEINTMTNFNIIFPLIKGLQLYQTYLEKVNGKQKSNEKQEFDDKQESKEKFVVCTVVNGQHKTYNEGIQNQFQNFKPQTKSANTVLSDCITYALYDMYIDYNGTLVVRPPLYNYLPLGLYDYDSEYNATPLFTNGSFVYDNNFIIPRSSILDFNYDRDNSKIEVRTDTQFTWPIYGVMSDQMTKPQFYEDLPALIKYGFRNKETKNNPNAMSGKMARVLAMYYNHQVNNGSRTLNITLKTDSDLTKVKFERGRLYYIDLPDINIDKTVSGQVEYTKKHRISKYGVVGYLRNITKAYKYGSYITYKLDFVFIRNVEIINLKNYKGADLNKVLLEIYNIAYPYGILEDMQTTKNRTISEKKYNAEKKTKLDKLYEDIKKNKLEEAIPIFKTLPTIMDIIELTYSDKDTKNGIKNKEKIEKENLTKMTEKVKVEDNRLCYHSWRLKLQRFLDWKTSGNTINYDANKTVSHFRPEMIISDPTFGTARRSLDPNDISKPDDLAQIKSIYDHTWKQSRYSNEKIIRNYQNFTFQLLNHTDEYHQNKDNIIPSWFKTMFDKSTINGIDFSNITQKLFNRIMEAEAEIYNKWSQDYCEELFYYKKDSTWDDWRNMDGPRVVDEEVTTLYELKTPSAVDAIVQEVVSTRTGGGMPSVLFNDLKTDFYNMPEGLSVYNPPLTTDKEINVYKKNKTEGYGRTLIIPFPKDTVFFSPGFLFNLITILNYNTLMAVPTEDNLKKLKENGALEAADAVKAHKDGCAIDFFLPYKDPFLNVSASGISMSGKSVPRMPFVYPLLLGNYTIKPEIYSQFEEILERYFDKVVRSTQTMVFDLNKLKGKNLKDSKGVAIQDLQEYAVYVYHVEVKGKNFLDPGAELLIQDKHCSIERRGA